MVNKNYIANFVIFEGPLWGAWTFPERRNPKRKNPERKNPKRKNPESLSYSHYLSPSLVPFPLT